jgi:hypothetical protein
MGTEDIYLTTNTKFMLGSGKTIISKVTENKNAKKQKCDTSGNSITTGSTDLERAVRRWIDFYRSIYRWETFHY